VTHDLTPTDLVEVAYAAAEVIKATKAIPTAHLEQYARHVSTYAGERAVVTGAIRGREMGMSEHVADVAEALAHLRRTIGDVDA